MITKSIAVESLRPNTQWVMYGDDVAGITWHTPDVEPLTEAEVAKEMKRLEKALDAEQATKDAARVSAVAKLSALGLDALEVQAIIGTV
jgi:hypothetical protein